MKNEFTFKEYLHLYKNIKFPSFEEKKKGKMLQEYKITSLKNRKMCVTCKKTPFFDKQSKI